MGKTYRDNSEDHWRGNKANSGKRKARKNRKDYGGSRYDKEEVESKWDDYYECGDPFFEKFSKKRKKR